MLLALAALACLAAPASAGAITAGGAISGNVTEAGSHEPIEALEVCAFPLEGEEEGEWHCSETDAAGDYEIANVPAGEWGVEFWGRPLGYVVQYWEDEDGWWEADPVVVDSTPVTGIDAELLPGGEVQGTVRAAAGAAPLEEVEVCAWGYPGEFFAGCAFTDSAGEYALRGLATAEYEIGFYPWEGNLLPQYYDHKDHWWEADFVPVGAEEVVTGIDADLMAGAQISGSVYSNATGAPLGSIYVCAIETEFDELRNCTESDEDGHYVLDRLPGGDYKVIFSIDFEEWYEEEFGEEEDDGYPTEFWNDQTTLAAANVISLVDGQSATGIDARLGPPALQAPGGSGPLQVLMPPAARPPVTTPAAKKMHCRKGLKRKKVKGKVRCVKPRRHRHRRHADRPAAAAVATVPPALRSLFEDGDPRRALPLGR
jgi:hypothetical protein